MELSLWAEGTLCETRKAGDSRLARLCRAALGLPLRFVFLLKHPPRRPLADRRRTLQRTAKRWLPHLADELSDDDNPVRVYKVGVTADKRQDRLIPLCQHAELCRLHDPPLAHPIMESSFT